MSAPSAPVIEVAPLSSDSTLEFAWLPPTSDGGDPILGYTITCLSDDGVGPFQYNEATFYAKITGLTNNTSYSFAIAAANGFGTGPQALFRVFQPGNVRPDPPATGTATAIGTTMALVEWTVPSITPDNSITYYVIESQSNNNADPILRLNTLGSKSSVIFTVSISQVRIHLR